MEQFPDTVLVLPLGDRARVRADYEQYRAHVKAVGYFPDYKIKKFWKSNLSIKDIEAGKHREIFPDLRRGKRPEGDYWNQRRGKAVNWTNMQIYGLSALIRELERRLTHYRVDFDVREQTRAMIRKVQERIDALKTAKAEKPRAVPIFSMMDLHRPTLLRWLRYVLEGGELPGDRLIKARQLYLSACNFDPKIREITATAFGIFLREQGLSRATTAEGSKWMFKELGEMRRQWDQRYGTSGWPDDRQEWDLGQ